MASTTARDVHRLARVRRIAASGEARAIRDRADLGAPSIARAVGVETVTIYRWETGQRRPSGDAALRYLELLELLDGGDDAA